MVSRRLPELVALRGTLVGDRPPRREEAEHGVDDDRVTDYGGPIELRPGADDGREAVDGRTERGSDRHRPT